MADSTDFGLKDIEYLVNGEYASGSNNTSSSAGVLNRPLVQIDANVRLLASVLAHQHNSDGSLKDSSVVTSMLDDGAVTEEKLGNGAVTEEKLDDGAITEAKLGSSSVTSGKIKDGAVVEGKLASNSVTSAKIASNAVTPAKTNFNSAVAMSSIEFSKTTSSSGHGGAIDFHYNGSTSDYTSRIIEKVSGRIDITAQNGLYLNGKELGSGGNLSDLNNDLEIDQVVGGTPYFVYAGYVSNSPLKLTRVSKLLHTQLDGSVTGNLGTVFLEGGQYTSLYLFNCLRFNGLNTSNLVGRTLRISFSYVEYISPYVVLRYTSSNLISSNNIRVDWSLNSIYVNSNYLDVNAEIVIPSDIKQQSGGQIVLMFFLYTSQETSVVSSISLY